MSPDQVDMILGLIQGLTWVAVAGGAVGGFVAYLVVRFVTWCLDRWTDPRFLAYRRAAGRG